MTSLTKEDIFIGNFLIEMFVNIEEYKTIYGEMPISVAVDGEHYVLIWAFGSNNWVDKESMKLNNGVQIIEETRWNGTFMSMRGDKYKSR